jgi:ABC-type transporter Mla MlaB component
LVSKVAWLFLHEWNCAKWRQYDSSTAAMLAMLMNEAKATEVGKYMISP